MENIEIIQYQGNDSDAAANAAANASLNERIDQALLTAAAVKGRRWLSEDGPGYDDLAAWATAESPAPVLAELAGTPGPKDEAIPSPDRPTDIDQASEYVV